MADEPIEASLEDMIRAAARNGELTHLSLTPIAGKGPKGVSWSASYSPASKWGSGFGNDPDPVKALKLAITDKQFSGLVKRLRTTLESADPPTKSTLRALKENLPKEVDDADFV